MNHRGIKLALALAMGCLVSLIAYVDLRQNSPGPLSRVHGKLAELEGRGGCSDCHGGWGQDMTSACLDCHEPIRAHLELGTGLHGNLDRIQAEACSLCHGEHHGLDFAVTNFKSFVLATAAAPEEFDHAFVDFELAGAHTELGCVECHLSSEVEQLAEGQQRYMGLSRNCASCHEDPHAGALAQACAECHGQDDFDDVFFLGHAEQLPLLGGHGASDCRACHAKGSSFSLESGLLGREPRACTACHDSPHAPQFVHGNALLAGLGDGQSCVTCHEPEHMDFADEGIQVSAAQHAVTGFKLQKPHAEQGCAECHAAQAGSFAERFPGREPLACGACHADPHAGQFALANGEPQLDASGKACIACHSTEAFEPHQFDAQKHATLALGLSGAHLKVGCNECHLDVPEGQARVFRGTESGCAACHENVHGEVFGSHIQAQELPANGQCALCHDTRAFQGVEDFDHAARTDFAVRGAHAASACSSCHAPLDAADELGRHFGRAPAGVAEAGCALCHDDPHQGVFSQRSAALGGEAGTECARCHVEHSFRELREPFDHGAWTGFDLTASHGELGCAECHQPIQGHQPGGLSWEHASGVSCGDCHASPHAGQFMRDGASDCAACHGDAISFKNLSFDHARQTSFPLLGEHAGLGCAACHETWVQGDLSVVRYRGVETECSACHGLQMDRLRGGK